MNHAQNPPDRNISQKSRAFIFRLLQWILNPPRQSAGVFSQGTNTFTVRFKFTDARNMIVLFSKKIQNKSDTRLSADWTVPYFKYFIQNLSKNNEFLRKKVA